MNTSWAVLFKALCIYIIAAATLVFINIAINIFIINSTGLEYTEYNSADTIIFAPFDLATLFFLLVPPITTGILYHLCTFEFPNGETRLTLSMLIAFSSLLISLISGYFLTFGSLSFRINLPQLELAQILSVLVILAVCYVINLLVASLGLASGLWFTRKRFAV